MDMIKFTPITLNLERTLALAKFLTACEAQNVSVKDVVSIYDGFLVRFVGLEGDAILHDGSIGRSALMWETYKMPWDEGDVSSHEAEELAEMIGKLQNGAE